MKLTTLLLVIALVQASAAGYSQIKLSVKKAPLETVLQNIEKQTDYDFFYNNKDINQVEITLSVNNASLKETLDKALDGLPITYEIKDNTVFLTKKTSTLLDRVIEIFKTIDVTGRVIDEKGQPLSSVTIKLKDNSQVTATDKDGYFQLRKVDEKAIILISSVGYLTKELPVKSDLGVIILTISESKLDEVQVIAYGTTSKRLSTGNSASIKAEDIEKQPVGNPLLTLAGRVPGLTVSQSSGLAGSGVTVRIQGLNSISKGNDPYYVVDGVPYVSQLLPNIGSVLGASSKEGNVFNIQTGNPFSFLNPGDIESITVLKDADATAIYGSRAANGAILVTTKKGEIGKTTGELTVQQGFGKVGRKLEVLNTQQYLALRREAYINDGLPVPTSATTPSNLNYDLTRYDSNRNTDWQKELLGGTSHFTDIQATVSGGTNQTSFKINSGYHRESTVFPGDFADVKGSFGLNLRNTSINNKFSIQLSATFVNDNNQPPVTDLTQTSLKLAPNAPALYKNGSLNWERIPSGTDSVSTWINPLATLNNKYQNNTSNLIANSLISYKLLKGLMVKASLGYNTLSQREIQTFPLTAAAPELRPTRTRAANYVNGNISSWIVEPQLTYYFNAFRGKFDFLVGTTFQENHSNVLNTSGFGYTADQLLKDPKSASSIIINSSLDSKYKYSALFGRINYNYDDKYIINVTGRRDGSSRFGINNQFQNFGAIGAAWIFSNEGFIKSNPNFLSYGKLRASYGTTGNDQIGDYAFLSLYTVPTGVTNTYQGTAGLLPTGHSNPDLQWEITKKLQAGIELGFFKDRIIFTANYFRNRSSNELLSYNLPIQTGYNFIVKNFPATVENRGWELSINSTNLQNSKFSWSSNFNITIPRNELIDFPGLSSSSYGSDLEIGKPIGITKAYQGAGVNPTTGRFQYLAVNGSVTVSPSFLTDRSYIYNPAPDFYGGLQNTITYKSLKLDFLVQFVKQMGLNYSIGDQPGKFGASGSTGNQPNYVLDRWEKVGDMNGIQRFSTTLFTTEAKASSFSYGDASYLRLKNVAITWELPQSVKQLLKVNNLGLFIHGQNLWTATHFKGLDPETRNLASLPVLRTWTFGAHVTF